MIVFVVSGGGNERQGADQGDGDALRGGHGPDQARVPENVFEDTGKLHRGKNYFLYLAWEDVTCERKRKSAEPRWAVNAHVRASSVLDLMVGFLFQGDCSGDYKKTFLALARG